MNAGSASMAAAASARGGLRVEAVRNIWYQQHGWNKQERRIPFDSHGLLQPRQLLSIHHEVFPRERFFSKGGE
ncbi:hypothetical protein ACFX15_036460 [Malus domestica]